MNSVYLTVCLLASMQLSFSTSSCKGETVATKLCDSLVDTRALTVEGKFGRTINGKSYQQDAVLTHANYQYVGYYDADRRVVIARRKLPRGQWKSIRFPDYSFQSQDTHNTISIGICPKDGTIHLAWDHHNNPLHYRTSNKHAANDPTGVEWTPGLFGPIQNELESEVLPKRLTYPRFLQTPDGGLQFFYREGGAGNGKRYMVDYDPLTGIWGGTRQIDSETGIFIDEQDQSKSRCSYPNGYSYGPTGRLHSTWVWREATHGNHDLVYVYSDDQGRSWRNNQGNLIVGPTKYDTPDTIVFDIPRSFGLMNTHGQAIDSKDRIHTVMWHCTDESIEAAGSILWAHRFGLSQARRYFHYWRDGNGEWHRHQLASQAGNRPKIFFDKSDNLILVFRAGAQYPNDAPLTLEEASVGDLVIMTACAKSNWSDWRTIHTEPGPFCNEILGDPTRWISEGILSVMVQVAPDRPHQTTPLRILDFRFETAHSH